MPARESGADPAEGASSDLPDSTTPPPPRSPQQPDLPPLGQLPLVQGELSPADAAELQQLKSLIERRVGFRCTGYKEKCLRRRIAVRMRARGVQRYAAYGHILHQDARELNRLLDTVTINVSRFFRNPEVWRRLQEELIPALSAAGNDPVNLLSVGVAAGEEAYSLAILVLEHCEAHGQDPGRFRILGLDIDRIALAAAERAIYGAYALQDTAEERRQRWFCHTSDGYALQPEVQRLVRFQRRDLLTESLPPGQHLIVCRNVLIYFERAEQRALFLGFYQALLSGGFLVLGKVETLPPVWSKQYRTVVGRERIFQKL